MLSHLLSNIHNPHRRPSADLWKPPTWLWLIDGLCFAIRFCRILEFFSFAFDQCHEKVKTEICGHCFCSLKIRYYSSKNSLDGFLTSWFNCSFIPSKKEMQTFFKQFLEDISPSCGTTDTPVWISGDISWAALFALGRDACVICSLRFTSGAIPVHLLVANMALNQSLPHVCEQALVGLESGVVIWTNLPSFRPPWTVFIVVSGYPFYKCWFFNKYIYLKVLIFDISVNLINIKLCW